MVRGRRACRSGNRAADPARARRTWTPEGEGAASPLLQAIRDTRKGQADLSEVLGERVREAVEILLQSHGEALKETCSGR